MTMEIPRIGAGYADFNRPFMEIPNRPLTPFCHYDSGDGICLARGHWSHFPTLETGPRAPNLV
jgi:hypothetical protein